MVLLKHVENLFNINLIVTRWSHSYKQVALHV